MSDGEQAPRPMASRLVKVPVKPTPILFCRIGWCSRYNGLHSPARGGATKGNDHERANFKPFGGMCYGYFPAKRWGTVAVEKLGATKGADFANGVLVVFFATSPHRGQVVVGWYRNAVVFRKAVKSPKARPQQSEGSIRRLYYQMRAREEDCNELKPPLRTIIVPPEITGSANHYFPQFTTPLWKRLLAKVENALGGSLASVMQPHGRNGKAWQQDIDKRLAVEIAGMMAAMEHPELQPCKNVSDQNKGWDLEARGYYYEVKAFSGSAAVPELTPNEWRKARKHRDKYRICLVTNALSHKQQIQIYRPSSGFPFEWRSQGGWHLTLKPVKVELARGTVRRLVPRS